MGKKEAVVALFIVLLIGVLVGLVLVSPSSDSADR